MQVLETTIKLYIQTGSSHRIKTTRVWVNDSNCNFWLDYPFKFWPFPYTKLWTPEDSGIYFLYFLGTISFGDDH